jgi:hypothetical protein
MPKEEPLDLFVSDVMGPFDNSVHGFKFAVTLRDHASMFTFVLPMHSKVDVPERLKTWFKTVHNHLGPYPKFLRCNNGGKFTSKHFENIIAKRCIQIVTSASYHPKENGKAKRVNQTINNMAQ